MLFQPFENVAEILKKMGLDDLDLLVKLMYLSAASKTWLPKQSNSTTLLDQVSYF